MNTTGERPRTIGWAEGSWTHPPVAAERDGSDLLVTPAAGSDAWRSPYNDVIADSEHALLVPFASGTAVEVGFTTQLHGNADQAGIFLRASATQWVKAGIELSDGELQLGAVVTNELSDWSTGIVPDWAGRRVTVRASRTGRHVTIRAKVEDEPFRLVRLIPIDPALELEAGPYAAAPDRAGLLVRFHSWIVTDADVSVH